MAVLTFNTKAGEDVLAKVGISSVDYEGANKNLEAEINHWNFDKVKDEAHETWKKELSKINVKGGTEDEKTIFYTSLYHTSISPNTAIKNYQVSSGVGADGLILLESKLFSKSMMICLSRTCAQ